MNSSILFHLIKKDFRVLRGWLLALWIFLPLQWLVVFFPENEPIHAFFMWIAPIVTASLIFFAQWRLFQIDTITGSNQFLQTRPISRTSRLASKFALWLFAIILPATLIHSLYPIGLGLQARDFALLFTGWLVFYLAVFGMLLIPTMLTRKFGTLLLSVLGFLALVFALNSVVDIQMPLNGSMEVKEHFSNSRIFAAQIIAIFLSLTTIVYFYRSRRIGRTLILAAIGCCLILLTAYAWPWNFVQAFAEKSLTVQQSKRPNTEDIRFLPCGNPTEGTTIGIENSNYQELNLNGEFQGLPRGWMIRQTNYTSTAVFSNGEKLDGSLKTLGKWHMQIESSASSAHLQKADHDLAILKLYSNANEAPNYYVRIFVSPLGRLPSEHDLNCQISGHADFELWHPKLIHALPLRNGETFCYRHRRWTIIGCRHVGNQLTATLVFHALDSELSPALNLVWNNPPAIRSIWLNPKANERMKVDSQFSTGFILDTYERIDHLILTRGDNQPMSAAYIAGVKLYIIDYEYGGDFSVPFDVPVRRIGIFDAR